MDVDVNLTLVNLWLGGEFDVRRMADLRRLSEEGRTSPLTIDKIAALGAEERERVKQAVQGGALTVHTPKHQRVPRAAGDPEPTVLKVPDDIRALVRGDTPPLMDLGAQTAGDKPNPPITAATVRHGDFASWGVDVGDSDNNDTALAKWNFEQYGVADVSALSDDQIAALRATRTAEQKSAQEEESRLLHFLTNRQAEEPADDALLFSGADEVDDHVFSAARSPSPPDINHASHAAHAAQPPQAPPTATAGTFLEDQLSDLDLGPASGDRPSFEASPTHWVQGSSEVWDRFNSGQDAHRQVEEAPDFLDSATAEQRQRSHPAPAPAATTAAKPSVPDFDLSAGVLAVQRTAWRSSEAARYGEDYKSPGAEPRYNPDVAAATKGTNNADAGSPGLWAVTEASVSGSLAGGSTPRFGDLDPHERREKRGSAVEYDSFPSLGGHEAHEGGTPEQRTPEEARSASRPSSTLETIGQWFGGVGVGLFGERPPSVERGRGGGEEGEKRPVSVVVPDASAPVKEGFMCPICMSNCGNAAELIECYERCAAKDAAAASAADEGPNTPASAAGAGGAPGRDGGGSGGGLLSPNPVANDASHAWANAIPTKELQIHRTSSPLDRRSTPLTSFPGPESGVPGPPVVSPVGQAEEPKPPPQQATPQARELLSPSDRREMYCLRCMERKTTVADAFCHGCGHAHMNRMAEQELELRLRVSSYGFGLGFKDHYVHKVQPGSTAEFSGLRVGDTIVRVNGQSVVEMPDVEVLTLIKTTAKTLQLVVKRVMPVQPGFGDGGAAATDASRQNPFSPDGAATAEDAQSPGLDFVTEPLEVDEAEVSQGVRDSTYVKMMRQRLEGYEAKLAERENTIKGLHSEKTRLAEELAAVMKQEVAEPAPATPGGPDSSALSMLDDMLPRLPTVSPTDYTLQNLCWSMEKHVSATRIAAIPLDMIAAELPDRVSAAIESEVEFQAAAANQVQVSQSIDVDEETTGQQQLAMSKASSRVISASDAKQQAEQRLAETLREIQTTVDQVQKTARLAEHHISKFSVLLEEMPQLGKLIISNEDDDEVTW